MHAIRGFTVIVRTSVEKSHNIYIFFFQFQHIFEREKVFPWRLLKTSEHETTLRAKRRGLPSPSIRRRPTFINGN